MKKKQLTGNYRYQARKIKFACGHTETVNVEREISEKGLAKKMKRVCSKCFCKQYNEQTEDANT